MKRITTMVLMGLMIIGTVGAHASTDGAAVPTLYTEESKPFVIEQNGDEFTITVSENASTGYLWVYQINKDSKVAFVSEAVAVPVDAILGAANNKSFTFTVLDEGVSTILFENKRSFGNEDVAESFTLLAYKSGNTVIIEEDQLVYAMDTAVPSLYTLNGSATYNGNAIEADVDIQEINGITMVPLRAVAEAMGYTITWNNTSKSVDIQQGAQWTSVIIGENRYFRNRMAPWELSSAPVIINSRTLVPVEFFADILGKGIEVNQKSINFVEGDAVIHKGYVKAITTDETGRKSLTLTSDLNSDDMMLQTIIHTSGAYTFYQKDVVEGDYVQVVSSMMMTASIPGQTSGYIVY